MKLYKLFTMGLVALTALAVTSLAATATNSGNKRPMGVPAFCDFGEGQYCKIVHGGLLMQGGPFSDDDSAGFTVRTSLAGGSHGRLDLSFQPGVLSFLVTDTNGAPIPGVFIVVFTEYGPNSTFQFLTTGPTGVASFDTHNGHLNPDEIQVALNDVFFFTGLPANMQVSNITYPNATQSLFLDATHVDDALGCD